MITIVNGIEYISTDRAGEPINYFVSAVVKNTGDIIHIESEIDGVAVQGIKDKAFANLVSLKEIELPDSIYRIGKQAFQNCTNLTTVRFYNAGNASKTSVTINAEAFLNCTELVEIDTIKTIHLNGRFIFSECEKLQTVNNGNTIVGNIYAFDFHNCKNLKNLHIAGKKCRMFTNCFKGAKNLETIQIDCETLQIPKSVLKFVGRRTVVYLPSCNLASEFDAMKKTT